MGQIGETHVTALFSTEAQNERIITLTPAQFDELNSAIERSSSEDDPVPHCYFGFQMCMNFFVAAVQLDYIERERIEYLPDGDIRMVRPSLDQLLDVRRRAVIRTK